MNAQEQIKMLRRACEMVKDWFAAEVTHQDFMGKWGMGSVGLVNAVRDALSATETPPDDLPGATVRHFHRAMTEEELRAVTTDMVVLEKDRDWLQSQWPRQVAEAIGSTPSESGATPSMLSAAVRKRLDGLAKERDEAREEALDWRTKTNDLHLSLVDVRVERDEALAKLAAVEKQRDELNAERAAFIDAAAAAVKSIYQRTTLWSEVASCRTEGTAKDIADALNSAGGGK